MPFRNIDFPRLLALPYAGLAMWLGLGYTLSAPRRTATPSLDAPKQLAQTLTDAPGMTAWGWCFLLGASLLLGAMGMPDRWHRREVLAALLFAGGVMYAFWGAIFAWGGLTDPRASLNAPGLYWFIAAQHFTAVWFINLLRIYRTPGRPQ